MYKINNFYTLEREDNFIWVHFPDKQIIHVDLLEQILDHLMDQYQTDMPLIFDLRTIEGFSVDAFELVLELLLNCHQHVALFSEPNMIGHKYAKLLEISVHNQYTKAFQNLQAAKHWVTH